MSSNASRSTNPLPKLRSPQAWCCALSPDGRWALVHDAQGRNLAEIHRPAVATGPDGRERTFAQVVRLMSAAPDLMTLVEEFAASGGTDGHAFYGPGGYKDLALALLVALR